jgi:hypothetical protein
MTTRSQICSTIAKWLTEPEPQNPNWSPEAWETFKFACRVHGVAPLLHQKLQAAGWINEGAQSWLAEQYRFNAQRVAKMHGELEEILALFAANDMPLMPLKGSILSLEFYPDPAWRPMADLDLLIRPNDFEAGARLLRQLGYEPDVTHWKHTEFSKPDNRQVVSTTGEHPDNPRKLEIHLHCRETFGGPTIELTELMWKNSLSGHLGGEPAILPKPELLWLHLLVHSTYHLWQGQGRLIHLVDLTYLTADINGMLAPGGSRIRQAGQLCSATAGQKQLPNTDTTDLLPVLNSIDARFTYPSLAMLKTYLPTSLDDKLLASQQRRVSRSYSRWVASLNLVNTSYLNPNPAGLYLTKALKFTEGRPREVMQALRFAFLPNLDEITLDHPRLAQSKLPWLAYFLLPLDWVKRLR